MATRKQAEFVASRYGMVLDESVTGKIGGCGTITFDHPTKSFNGDCHSITVSGYCSMSRLWAEAIDRIQRECLYLTPCTNPDCEYHNS